MTDSRLPFPPFDIDSALAQVEAAEDAWNTRDPRQVALACTEAPSGVTAMPSSPAAKRSPSS